MPWVTNRPNGLVRAEAAATGLVDGDNGMSEEVRAAKRARQSSDRPQSGKRLSTDWGNVAKD
ncbi:hypothetical protein NIIDMKKI_27610 [Mycobacterium kansasii]|uniref:Uncharacterized protein n=1 Tax=Mycobacterium kansasii TaxID=1768 RepID=A0A7G1ICT8_MYCKA|nr:hypothetical protein NIIDMKKI_27610 [Mycobacterium kansasii]